MIVYTAEDFAQATLATRGEFGAARRTHPNLTHQWHAYGGRQGWFSDEEMAAAGWEPVVEDAAHDRIMALLDAKKAHEQTIEGLRHDLALARKELVGLRQENRRLEAGAEGAVSLGGLKIAWETAEVPTDDAPTREGDVVIYTSACGTGVTVHKAAVGQFGRETHGYVRILSRAPRREPWADLADALRGTVWARLSGDVDGLAAAVHAAGWRKGGEEA